MIFASNNERKVSEIKAILGPNIKSLAEAGIKVEIEEDQNTFYGNALKKAMAIYDLTHEEVIADDSGLCINALGGYPGVLTHRFMGEEASKEERYQALLAKLEGKEDRSAEVICSLVYYNGEDIIEGKGILKGWITKEIRGNNGFDDIFTLDGIKSMGELTPEEKNKISARAMAARDLKNKLLDLEANKELTK